MSKKEDLPSINDYQEDSELPSYKDFIEEEKELPSVEDYITQQPLEEDQTIEDANGNTFAEVIDVIKAPEWGELVKLVNDVRKEIPEIPEIKSYDEEIAQISEKIAEISDNFSQYDLKSDKIYDLRAQNEQFEEKLTEIEQKIPEIPEIRYYEGDIELIYNKISRIKEEIESLPEVKYYENDLDVLKSRIEEVNENIPTFPKWVNEVNEVPDFSWIGKTFGVIDDDFKKVQTHLDIIKDTIDSRVSELNETIETKDFEQRVDSKTISENLDSTNTRLTETKDKIYKELREMTLRVYDHHKEFKDDDRKLKKAILSEQNKLKQTLKEQIKSIENESIKTDEKIISFYTDLREEVDQKFNSLPEVKYYDKDIKKLQVEVKNVKTDLKDLVTELYKIATVIKKQQKTLTEGLLNEPPNERETAGGQTDPLTPLDQKFATLDDLSKHYRLFINRIQTQLSTMGGGGAGFIKDLDDVTFDGSDNQLLIYNASTSKWVGIDSSKIQGSVGAAGTWGIDSVGIHTVKSVGINTTTAKAGVSLHVIGDIEATGNVNVGGTITYDDVVRIDSLGLSTFRSGVEVNTGTATTALLVRGDARITGILTIGESSVTIDGDNNTVTTGIVTITNSQVILGSNVTINASATGINSAPNVFYVAKDGDDTNNGTSIDNAKLTIAGAVSIANTGSVIKVLSGNYVENNPIELPAFSAIVGDDLRTVKVLPNNTTQDLFHVNKGCKLANMTFSGHVHPAAAVAFPTGGATNVGGGKWKGPYIQNCTSDTTTGIGVLIDGDKAEKTKSMNVDAFTQYNQGGVGVAVTNEGYAQLVSVFTICCDKAITVHKGGQADVANSNCSFGTFGLIADGVSDQQFTGIVTTSAAAGQDSVIVNVGGVTTRPYDGQVVFFDTLFKSVESITITSGGSGYTSTPSVTVSTPSGPNGEVATAFATIEGGVVTSIDIISSGSQYTGTATITISAPDSGTTATATAVMSDTYFTINSATPISSGITTLTLAENLFNTVGVGSTAYFFQQSKIVASSHTFEYIGSGNTITGATPKRGGVTIQANEAVSQNGGRVIYTSTDQSGNFRIGDDLQINQATGTISGRAFSKSLFSEMTPFILALS
jgi:hypothetical protein